MQTIESADSKLTQITLPAIDTYLLTSTKPLSLVFRIFSMNL